MSDLIDRKIAIQGIRELFHLGECYCDEFSIVGMLNILPSVELERKKGKWEYPRKFGHTHLLGKCSICGKFESAEWIVLDNPNFCPNCGADMRGKNE